MNHETRQALNMRPSLKEDFLQKTSPEGSSGSLRDRSVEARTCRMSRARLGRCETDRRGMIGWKFAALLSDIKTHDFPSHGYVYVCGADV